MGNKPKKRFSPIISICAVIELFLVLQVVTKVGALIHLLV